MNRPAAMTAAPASGEGSHTARAFWGEPTFVFALLFAGALAPVLWFSLPVATAHYPNHLARMYVLARAGTAQRSRTTTCTGRSSRTSRWICWCRRSAA